LKEIREKFELLKNAIIKKQAIAFTYASSYGETTERTVHPLKLVFKSKAWYLQGYCLLKNDYRTFKINRMLAVEMLNKNFSDKQYEAPLIDSPDVESTAMTKVVLKVAAHMAYRAYDEFDEDSIARNDDGTLTITANLPQDEWLYNFILSFGTAMRIIEPRQMRDELLLYAVEVKDFYLKG
jgi:Predicted transcriptional regulator